LKGWDSLWPGNVLKISAVYMRLVATATQDERSRALDGGAVVIARRIRDRREYAHFPALANALARGGCTDADLLAVCRQPEAWAHNEWLLDALLGEEPATYPDFYESWSQLCAAGWYNCGEEMAGPPHAPVWRVTGRHNDGRDLDVTGATQAEAWHRAVEQTRSLGMLGRTVS
jgi:hypothetical protein